MPVYDIKPDNKVVINPKPSNKLVNRPTQVYTDDKFYSKGQPMGLLLSLTYPVAGTWPNTPRL